MNKASEKRAEQAEALAWLRQHVKPGTTVYTVLRHVSRSGMLRHISLLFVESGKIVDISWYVALALEYKLARDGGLKVGGCGMDMGFHLVNSLSYALHGTESKGPDAIAAEGRPFTPTAGQYRAGYSLIHAWA